MTPHRLPILVAAGLALAGGGAWYFLGRGTPPAPAPAPVAAPIANSAPEPPAIAHPLATDTAGGPLPPLAEADGPLAQALGALPGGSALGALLRPDLLLRHFVATVDNLPRHHLTAGQRPLRAVAGAYAVAGGDLAGTPDDARNVARYEAALKALEAIDPQALVALYRRWYPLLQQAYEDLGYPQGYFNDRLVAAIDDLLAAPQPAERPALARPNVLWLYADASLEQRSAGQRLMLRLPPAQSQRLRERLVAIRALVAGGP